MLTSRGKGGSSSTDLRAGGRPSVGVGARGCHSHRKHVQRNGAIWSRRWWYGRHIWVSSVMVPYLLTALIGNRKGPGQGGARMLHGTHAHTHAHTHTHTRPVNVQTPLFTARLAAVGEFPCGGAFFCRVGSSGPVINNIYCGPTQRLRQRHHHQAKLVNRAYSTHHLDLNCWGPGPAHRTSTGVITTN